MMKRLILMALVMGPSGCGGSAVERCPDQKYVEQVRQDEHRRDAERARREERMAREQQDEAASRAVRAAPRSLELGATPAESAVLCRAQSGTTALVPATSKGGSYHLCRVKGATIYAGLVPHADEVFTEVTTYYEGADIGVVRASTEGKHGPADRIDIQAGFRVWTWETTAPHIELTSYADGVSVTLRVATPPATPSEGGAAGPGERSEDEPPRLPAASTTADF